MDVAATTGLTSAGATAEAASGKLAENFDTFLTLLVAQLQNQDPLEPTDTKDFVQQLVQFSEVEQQIDTNASLEKMLEFGRAKADSNNIRNVEFIQTSIEDFDPVIQTEMLIPGNHRILLPAITRARDQAKGRRSHGHDPGNRIDTRDSHHWLDPAGRQRSLHALVLTLTERRCPSK